MSQAAETTVFGRLVRGKFAFGLVKHDGDAVLFRIVGDGGVGPQVAPNPATRDELDAWIDRLQDAGYRVTDRLWDPTCSPYS